MKGDYIDGKDNPNDMFAKFNQTQKFQQHPPLHPHHPHPLPHHQHHFQLTRETQASEEADNRSPGSATPTIPTPTTKKEPTSDGATIEVVRRPRGRPPGSKNKPKPPIIITRDTEHAMSPYVLELPGGVDVVEAITRFCRKRNMGICVLNGSGTVANVSLRQPTTPGATVTFHGRFDILSLSATVLPASMTLPVANGFAISLAGPQGQIIGGMVAGALPAAGTVYLIAAAFNNPSFHRLPVEEDVRNSGSGGNEGHSHSPPAVSGGVDSGHPPAVPDSCGMSIYSAHMPSDVIWAPAARQPPPRYG